MSMRPNPKVWEQICLRVLLLCNYIPEGAEVSVRSEVKAVEPGNYEIDILALVHRPDFNDIKFVGEVKCKKRNITRPEIQNLLQTKTAVRAHHAFLVSKTRFSDEAMDFAEHHGIDLIILDTVPTDPTKFGKWLLEPHRMNLRLKRVGDRAHVWRLFLHPLFIHVGRAVVTATTERQRSFCKKISYTEMRNTKVSSHGRH